MKNFHPYPFRLNFISGILFVCILLVSSCKKDKDENPDNVLNFESTAVLSSGMVTSTATGSLTATYNEDTKLLSYTFMWAGLTGTIGGFHIHKGDGAVSINFKDDGFSTAQSGTFSGSTVLSLAEVIQDLKDSKLYGQIHTGAYPGGELQFPFTLK